MGYAIMDSNDEIKAIEAELGRELTQDELAQYKIYGADELLNPVQVEGPIEDWEFEMADEYKT